MQLFHSDMSITSPGSVINSVSIDPRHRSGHIFSPLYYDLYHNQGEREPHIIQLIYFQDGKRFLLTCVSIGHILKHGAILRHLQQ